MQAFEAHNGSDADNVNENIGCEDEELEFEHERAQVTEYPTQDLLTSLEVQAMIATEVKKSIAEGKAHVLTELVKDMLNDALQVGYNAIKEGMKTLVV